MAKHSFTERYRIAASYKFNRKDLTSTPVPARDIVVEILIDTALVARRMAHAAANNKSRQARQIGGAVTVRLMSDKEAE